MLASLCSAAKSIPPVGTSYQKINDMPSEVLRDQIPLTSLQSVGDVHGRVMNPSSTLDPSRTDWRQGSQIPNVTAPPPTMHSPFPGLGATNYVMPAEPAPESYSEERVNSEGRDEVQKTKDSSRYDDASHKTISRDQNGRNFVEDRLSSM